MKEKLNHALYIILGNRVYFLVGLITIVVIIMSSMSPYFLTVNNLLGMTRFGAVLALVALGETLVILAGGGGIDLSVGAILSLSGILFGMMMKAGIPLWAAAIACIVIAGILGAVNGLTIAKLGLPPLIGTLGTMYAYGALALVLSKGIPVSGFPKEFGFLGQGMILKIPVQVLLIVVPLFILLQFITSKTKFGRNIYLVGVNEQAARFAGISVINTRFVLYTLSGILAGFGAIIMASYLMTARADVGNGLELQAITVAMLGGTNIMGGTGSLVGTILAVLIVTMVASGLQLANVNTIWQLAVLGLILLGAVAINQAISNRDAKRHGIA
jgi:ribose/xylose/arabinose/galactoside ABC-type transport system permease subunit